MSIKSDKWIRRMARETDMINPFVEGQVRHSEGGKVISYGTSSYGYDVRCANEFKIFTNINSVIVDPKNFDPNSFVDVQSDVCIIPPNSFALARTVEYFKIPRDVLVVCLGKSTYARVGIIVNVTPLEPCFSSDTEILTKNGWKYFNEIVIGSEVLTMNPQTRIAEWQNVDRIQAYTYRGDLLHFNSRGVDLLVTPDHSLYVDKLDSDTHEWQGWHKTKAEKVFAQDDYRMSRHVNWQGTDIDDEIIIANTTYNTNSLLEFIGMYLTAGWCSYGKLMGKVINIKTTSSDDTDKLQSVLSMLGKSAHYNGTAWQINCSELAEYLQEFGQHHHSNMPQWLKALPRHRLQLLLKGLKLNESKASIYTTVSARLADDIQEVIFKVGLAATLCNCSIAEVQKQANGHDSISQYTVFKIRQSIATDNLKLSAQSQKKVPYTGMVYDVTVPNHIIFVRRNGKAVWSGNCWEGHVTLEFSNTTPLPAKIYANEGVAQLLFFGGDEECETSYKDREGKYQGQTGITLPKA